MLLDVKRDIRGDCKRVYKTIGAIEVPSLEPFIREEEEQEHSKEFGLLQIKLGTFVKPFKEVEDEGKKAGLVLLNTSPILGEHNDTVAQRYGELFIIRDLILPMIRIHYEFITNNNETVKIQHIYKVCIPIQNM